MTNGIKHQNLIGRQASLLPEHLAGIKRLLDGGGSDPRAALVAPNGGSRSFEIVALFQDGSLFVAVRVLATGQIVTPLSLHTVSVKGAPSAPSDCAGYGPDPRPAKVTEFPAGNLVDGVTIRSPKKGDRVLFGRTNGQKTVGKIIKVNEKSFKVETEEVSGKRGQIPAGVTYRVHKSLVSVIEKASA